MNLNDILILAGAILVGAVSSQIIFRKLNFIDLEKTRAKSEAFLNDAKSESSKIQEDAKINSETIRTNTDEMLKQMKTLIHTIEQNVKFKEEALVRKANKNSGYKEFVDLIEQDIKKTEGLQSQRDQLFKEKLAAKLGVRIEDLTHNYIDGFTKDLALEAEEKIAKYMDHVKDTAEKKGKNILKNAMQKFTDRTSVEKKEAIVSVPRDEVKAEIVGRNSANILLFEQLTEVDVIFNDEPNTILVSSFDLVKKSIARIAISGKPLIRPKKLLMKTLCRWVKKH
jgi:ribonuclease Y